MRSRRILDLRQASRLDWLHARRRGIGGSDASAAAGRSRWKSQWRLWAEKSGILPLEQPSEAAEWGLRLEDELARWYAERTGYHVRRVPWLLAHPERPWQLATIDRAVGRGGAIRHVLDCKVTANEELWEGVLAGKLPQEWQDQLTHYAVVTGATLATVAVLYRGQHATWVDVEPTTEAQRELTELEGSFWALVESGKEPPKGIEDRKELARGIHAETGKVVVLPVEMLELFERYRSAREAVREAEARLEEIALEVREALGDAEEAVIAGETVATYREVVSRRVDTEDLRREWPLVYQSVLREHRTRRLSVK